MNGQKEILDLYLVIQDTQLLAENVVIMPSFVNLGAYVDSGYD